MSEDEDETPTPPTPSAGLNGGGGGLKRKRDGGDEERIKAHSDVSKSPIKRMKSESPCAPTPPPAPTLDTPAMQPGHSSPASANGDVSKRKREHDDDEDCEARTDISRSPAKRMSSNSPPNSLVATNGNSRKRGRDEDKEEEEENKVNSDTSESPAKRSKSESPVPPPPPPGPPVDTPPMQSEDASPGKTPNQLHADTSFAEKSMADVLAEAQQDPGDGDDVGDLSMQDANDRWARSLASTRARLSIDAADDLSAGPSTSGSLPHSPIGFDNFDATSPRPWPNELTIGSPPRSPHKHSPRPDAIKADL